MFWPSALTRLTGSSAEELDDALHALERKEFIRRERRSSIAGEQQYAFLHALVRDVAYGQLPRLRRIEKHRLTAEWIATLARDRSEDYADLLAHHYLEALKLTRTLGADIEPLREPSIEALLEAGRRAAALNAWPAAREHARQALELLAMDDVRRPQALFAELNATWMVGQPTVERHLETREALVAIGDTETAATVASLLGRLYWLRGERDAYEAHGAQAMALAETLPPSPTKARIFAARARILQLSGDSQTALELARRTLPIVEPEAEPALVSRVLTTIGMARVHLGDRSGVADLERAAALAETARSPDDLHTALNNLANMHWRLGELDEAKVRHEQARQADEHYGYENGLRWLVAERLFDHMLRGEWNEALPLAEAVLAEHDPVTSYLHMPTYLMRALVEAGRSQRDAALADSEQALTSARRSQDAQQLGPAILGRAQVLVTIGRSHEANELVDELMVDADLADPWLHELPLLLCELGRGVEYAATLARDQRRSRWLEAGLAAASGRHAEAVEIYGAIGARVAQARARLLHAGVLHAEGRTREAQAELDAAINWFRAIGATYYAGRCDAILQASA